MSIQNCVAINAELQSMRYKVLNLYSYYANCYTHVGTQYCNYYALHMICCCTHIVRNATAITVCMIAFAILHSCCTHMDTTIIDCMIACISSCTHALHSYLPATCSSKSSIVRTKTMRKPKGSILFYPILFYIFYSVLFYSIFYSCFTVTSTEGLQQHVLQP